MGRPIRSQRQGKGMPRYLSTKRAQVDLAYPSYDDAQKKGVIQGEVIDFVLDRGRNAVLSKVLFEGNKVVLQLAAEGMFVGQGLSYGLKADASIGNVLPLGSIGAGTPVFNIEKRAGDGGTFIRSAGGFGAVVAKDSKQASVKLPSGSIISLPLNARATIGNVSCGEIYEKPLIKAGNSFHKFKARRKPWHRCRGVKMNPVDHPFGGSSHHAGKSMSTSRNAPPGRKVGHIASSRTGRKKK